MNDASDITKTYTNGEITVVWKPAVCIHSKICWTQLIEVFNPRQRPWIDMAGAETTRIAEQVDRCPSKALSYFRNDEAVQPESTRPA
ncbi:(4Fe-4S)-binding protein [Spirosoma montaniterrae]|uniref:(4Fe-4S)-binding protein n=1 Tax=Spirosoma montaniterrae TaxID=1178516 RepID=A0A1P9WSI5_9BACT|nr:(4Fe-4S)-binding protein [Spirosoma montaniterrae]AQG78332.1 (4Fe-4S)-binding protein [Spirosoma montaniterrae]